MAKGSNPYPSIFNMPNCHTNEHSEQNKGRKVKVASTPAFILVDEDDAAEETDTSIDNSTDTEKDISGINESNETDTSKEDQPVEAEDNSPSWMG